MSVHVIINRENNGLYNGMRQLRATDSGQVVDTVVDWSDAQNPDLKVMLMDRERATITQNTLRIMGYANVEILSASGFGSETVTAYRWAMYGAIAVLFMVIGKLLLN